MIIDASVVIDAVADPGDRGAVARAAIGNHPPMEPLVAPGILAFEMMSGLHAAARRPGHPLDEGEVSDALADAAAYEIRLERIPWDDVLRAWELSQGSLRCADAIFVAAADRLHMTLLTSEARIERSGAMVGCTIMTL